MTTEQDEPKAGDGAEPTAEATAAPTTEPTDVSAGEMFGDDEPAVPEAPPVASDDDLRDAVGAVRRDKISAGAPRAAAAGSGADRAPEPADDDDDDDDRPKKRGRAPLVLAVALLAGGAIASTVLLGRSNSDRYFFVCGEARISAERGRSFPPWGSERLGGAEWKPIEIPPGAECESRETSDATELAGWYLEALVAQAQSKLTAKEVTAVDRAQAELEQALLLARDPERRDQRREIDRLLGDVEYWRGAARVKAAIETLDEAGRRFDVAADKRPRHASDAAAWAEWVRRLSGELAAGPGGVRPDPTVAPGDPPRPDVPTGVALPVEAPSEPIDAGVTAPAIDAGLPQGGVLL